MFSTVEEALERYKNELRKHLEQKIKHEKYYGSFRKVPDYQKQDNLFWDSRLLGMQKVLDITNEENERIIAEIKGQ